jgi:hypothetical protein
MEDVPRVRPTWGILEEKTHWGGLETEATLKMFLFFLFFFFFFRVSGVELRASYLLGRYSAT